MAYYKDKGYMLPDIDSSVMSESAIRYRVLRDSIPKELESIVSLPSLFGSFSSFGFIALSYIGKDICENTYPRKTVTAQSLLLDSVSSMFSRDKLSEIQRNLGYSDREHHHADVAYRFVWIYELLTRLVAPYGTQREVTQYIIDTYNKDVQEHDMIESRSVNYTDTSGITDVLTHYRNLIGNKERTFESNSFDRTIIMCDILERLIRYVLYDIGKIRTLWEVMRTNEDPVLGLYTKISEPQTAV